MKNVFAVTRVPVLQKKSFLIECGVGLARILFCPPFPDMIEDSMKDCLNADNRLNYSNRIVFLWMVRRLFQDF